MRTTAIVQAILFAVTFLAFPLWQAWRLFLLRGTLGSPTTKHLKRWLAIWVYLFILTTARGVLSQPGLSSLEDLCRFRGGISEVIPSTSSLPSRLDFPFSVPCNTHVDLVPWWVNPLFIVSLVCIVAVPARWAWRKYLGAKGASNKENGAA